MVFVVRAISSANSVSANFLVCMRLLRAGWMFHSEDISKSVLCYHFRQSTSVHFLDKCYDCFRQSICSQDLHKDSTVDAVKCLLEVNK